MAPHKAEKVVVKVAAATEVAAEVDEVDGAEGATAVTIGVKADRIESKKPEHIVKRRL